jgi:hypothetical protein
VYVLSRADLGHEIRVTLIASNRHGRASATSRPTAVIRRRATRTPTPSPPSALGLQVVGTRLLTAGGRQVVLHGVDRSGADYACEQKFGLTDGPSGDAEFASMVRWHINTVVIGLNQDCWLGINGVPGQYAGQKYIDFIKSEVASMEKYGIYPTIGFFVGEPGTDTPNWYSIGNGNPPMPNNDHVPLVWEEVADTFKNDPNVIFRLYEEPYPASNSTGLAAWRCWSRGDVQYGTGSVRTPPTPPTPVSANRHCGESDAQGHAYQTVGMQSLVNIIRGTGATNVIQVPGVAFANMYSCSSSTSPLSCGFLDSADGVRVWDALNPPQLMGDTDNYPDNGQYCETVSCLDATYAPVAAVMPIDFGEIGVTNSNGPMTQTQAFLNWADSHQGSYYAYVWDTWGPLIADYSGTPKSPWGTAYKARLASFG